MRPNVAAADMSMLFFRTLSQGLQAFTPVAVALAWCASADDRSSASAIRRGLVLSVPATIVGAWWFHRSAARALDEAILAALALAIALVCARSVRYRRVDTTVMAAAHPRRVGSIPLVLATVLIVVRQTMEIGSVLTAAAFEVRSLDATRAVLGGVAVAVAVAWLWTRVARALTPRSVAAATRSFADIFIAVLALYAFHEMAEARLLPWSEALHVATEPYGPDGVYGVHVADLLIVGPLTLLAWTAVGSRTPAARARATTVVGRMRLGATVIVIACVLLMGLQRADARLPHDVGGAAPADIAAIVARPHVIFRDTTPGANFGKLAVTAIDDLRVRVNTALSCERVSFAHVRGLCLHVDRGIFNRYSAVLLNGELEGGASIKLPGLPSRTRVAADGRVGAVTVFVLGDDYASSFSTRTTIVDLSSGDEIGELEQFATWRNAARFRAVDFNFWGVTFARDGNTFYASLRTAGTTYLVRGELALRKLTVLREGAECPSLSPDNRLLAYKKRVGPSPDSWRLHVLDLATGVERLIPGETRFVDDQVEWLDAQHLLYAIPRRTTAVSDVWVVSIDDSAPAHIFLSEAESPSVVR